jgi:hypothetical protein
MSYTVHLLDSLWYGWWYRGGIFNPSLQMYLTWGPSHLSLGHGSISFVSQHRSLTAIGQKKAPLTHWFSLEIYVIGTERRAQVTPTCSMCMWTIGAMDRTSGQPPGQAEPTMQYFFKTSTTGQSGNAVYESIIFYSIYSILFYFILFYSIL